MPDAFRTRVVASVKRISLAVNREYLLARFVDVRWLRHDGQSSSWLRKSLATSAKRGPLQRRSIRNSGGLAENRYLVGRRVKAVVPYVAAISVYIDY
jgi:hypothetical protein